MKPALALAVLSGVSLFLTSCQRAAPAEKRAGLEKASPRPSAETLQGVPIALPPAAATPPSTPATEAAVVPDRVCPPGTVFIPPTGPDGFQMGRSYRGQGTDPEHRVILTKSFCMDETEVTVRAFMKCVEAEKCKKPYLADTYATYPRMPDHPVNMVNWVKARAFCAFVDKRLPTEAEWEWAASGPHGSRYPWGDGPDPTCGVGLADFTPGGAPKSSPGGDHGCFGGGTSPVKAHAKGKKSWPGGDLYDLAGNVWEWTEDSYEPYTKAPQTDPLVRAETANHAIRGGAWNRAGFGLQNAYRGSAVFRYQVPGLGFRCVAGDPHPTPPPRVGQDPARTG